MKKATLIILFFVVTSVNVFSQVEVAQPIVKYEYVVLRIRRVFVKEFIEIFYPDGSWEEFDKLEVVFDYENSKNISRLVKAMNYLGDQGYELFSVRSDSSSVMKSEYIFKRKVE